MSKIEYNGMDLIATKAFAPYGSDLDIEKEYYKRWYKTSNRGFTHITSNLDFPSPRLEEVKGKYELLLQEILSEYNRRNKARQVYQEFRYVIDCPQKKIYVLYIMFDEQVVYQKLGNSGIINITEKDLVEEMFKRMYFDICVFGLSSIKNFIKEEPEETVEMWERRDKK